MTVPFWQVVRNDGKSKRLETKKRTAVPCHSWGLSFLIYISGKLNEMLFSVGVWRNTRLGFLSV